MYRLAAAGSYAVYHLAQRTQGKAVLFEKIETPILHENFFGIETFLAGKQDDINVGVEVPYPLKGVEAIHLAVEIIIQDDDGRTFAEIRDAGFSVGIEVEIAAEGLELLSDKALIDNVIFDHENNGLLR